MKICSFPPIWLRELFTAHNLILIIYNLSYSFSYIFIFKLDIFKLQILSLKESFLCLMLYEDYHKKMTTLIKELFSPQFIGKRIRRVNVNFSFDCVHPLSIWHSWKDSKYHQESPACFWKRFYRFWNFHAPPWNWNDQNITQQSLKIRKIYLYNMCHLLREDLEETDILRIPSAISLWCRWDLLRKNLKQFDVFRDSWTISSLRKQCESID